MVGRFGGAGQGPFRARIVGSVGGVSLVECRLGLNGGWAMGAWGRVMGAPLLAAGLCGCAVGIQVGADLAGRMIGTAVGAGIRGGRDGRPALALWSGAIPCGDVTESYDAGRARLSIIAIERSTPVNLADGAPRADKPDRVFVAMRYTLANPSTAPVLIAPVGLYVMRRSGEADAELETAARTRARDQLEPSDSVGLLLPPGARIEATAVFHLPDEPHAVTLPYGFAPGRSPPSNPSGCRFHAK